MKLQKVSHRLRKNKKLLLFCLISFLCGIFFSYSVITLFSSKEIEVKAIPNRAYFPYVHEKFQNAKNFIHIVMFQISYYEGYNESAISTLLQDLINAKKRGVDVKLILESGDDFLGEDFFEKQKNACSFLQNFGIQVKFDPEDKTTHAKLILVDNTAIIGSTNWNYYALEQNNEASAAIVSEIFTAAYEQYFWNLWRNSKEVNCSSIKKIETNLTISEILSNKEIYDGKKVRVSGKVYGVKKKISKFGNEYTTFTLVDDSNRINIFISGHPEISENVIATVYGTYRKEKVVFGYKYYNEIEAEEILKN